MEVYYFTYTGLSKTIAEKLGEILRTKPKEITTLRLPYGLWLFLSFFPGLGVKSKFEPPSSKDIILCFPKWTFNCPPVTYFLKKLKSSSIETLIFVISYRGWGQPHYEKIYKKLALNISKNVKIFFIKKKRWDKDFEKMLKELKLQGRL